MFKTLEEMAAAFAGSAPDALRDVIAGFLVPVSVLVPLADQNTASLTFVGGAPVMSQNLAWPVPPLAENIAEIAERGGMYNSDHIRKALENPLPYSFFGQVDLSQLNEADLPNSGRLLFFYDLATGPWDTSVRSAKVIWDQAPLAEVMAFPLNEALLAAEVQWNAEASAYVPEPFVLDAETREIMRAVGLTDKEIDAMAEEEIVLPPHEYQRVYFGPKRVMQVEVQLQTPTPWNLEWAEFARVVTGKYGEGLTAEGLADIYSEAEIFYSDGPFQVLGLPLPVQDDPRHYAAAPLLLGQQFLTGEEADKHEAELGAVAGTLRLLFQVPVADWQQENTEGTVYFLISDSDLKARNFDAVIAVYQQT